MADTTGRDTQSSRYRRPNLVFFVVVAVMFAILVSLGNWQVRRLEWKEGLIGTIEQRIRQEPVELNRILTRWQDSADVEYFPVRLSGRFRHGDEQHFLATHNGQSGWYLYTPLEMADGRVVIVNRGFVPFDFKDQAVRPWKPVQGLVTITGLARNPLTEKPGWVVPENTPADSTWYWKDFAGMAKAMGLSGDQIVPFFVDASATENQSAAGPVPGVTRIVLPNRHLEYALTWFGLAAALVATAAFVVWRGMRRPKAVK
ncbi:MAG: SURF1 family protein [Alphaproteobacteria bacterium]|nr:SURF1 family protein [Alphaproteobacteria bacterium]